MGKVTIRFEIEENLLDHINRLFEILERRFHHVDNCHNFMYSSFLNIDNDLRQKIIEEYLNDNPDLELMDKSDVFITVDAPNAQKYDNLCSELGVVPAIAHAAMGADLLKTSHNDYYTRRFNQIVSSFEPPNSNPNTGFKTYDMGSDNQGKPDPNQQGI